MKRLLVLLPLIALLTGCGFLQTSQPVPRVNEYELGKKAYEQENYTHAVQYQDQWLAKYPQDAAAYVERGRAYDKLGRYDEALMDYSKSIELSPTSVRPKLYKAGALDAVQRKKEAQQTLAEVLAHPGFASLGAYEQFLGYLLDGQFKLQAKEFNAALESLNVALEIYETNTTVFLTYKSPHIHRLALRNRAVANSGLGYFNDAVTDMEEYIKINEKNNYEITAGDYKQLALVYNMTEQFDKCQEIYDKLSPQDQQALTEVLGHTGN